jgi:tripartite-type tricarboxylate transporter receptor subunit TctC
MRKLIGAFSFWTAALSFAVGAAQAQDKPFYEGKTISIIVGFGPGGGYDLYSRLLAQYLGKYILGHPRVVVQNMDGAGGVRAANYIYSNAVQDGTYIASVNQGAAMFQLLGGDEAKYDLTKVGWLGSIAASNNVAYVWSGSGVATLDDAKKREVALAGSGIISDSDIYPAVLNAIVGTKFKVIDGYTGTNDSNLAIERGEVAGRGGGAYSNLVSTKPDWLRDKKIIILAQTGLKKDKDLPNVPLLIDLAKTEEDRQIAMVVTLPTVIGYNQWVGPGVPADRLALLRKAYASALADPDLLADAKKQNLDIVPKTGEEIAALVKQAGGIPKPVLDRTAEILGWSQKHP